MSEPTKARKSEINIKAPTRSRSKLKVTKSGLSINGGKKKKKSKKKAVTATEDQANVPLASHGRGSNEPTTAVDERHEFHSEPGNPDEDDLEDDEDDDLEEDLTPSIKYSISEAPHERKYDRLSTTEKIVIILGAVGVIGFAFIIFFGTGIAVTKWRCLKFAIKSSGK